MMDFEGVASCLRRAFYPSSDPADPVPRTPSLKEAIRKNETIAVEVREVIEHRPTLNRTMRDIADRMRR